MNFLFRFIDICDLVSIVNDIYKLSLFFCSTCCFIVAVTTLFDCFYDIATENRMNLLKSFICIVSVTQFYLICWICTLVCQESRRTGRIIYEVILKCKPVNFNKHEANPSSLEVQPPLENLDGEQSFNRSSSHNLSYVNMENFLRRYFDRECVTKEINDFSIQLQQHRIAFTACNFFEINNSLFRSVSALFVYFITIIIELVPFEIQFQ